ERLQVLLAPTLPEAFDEVVFETELGRILGELLHALQAARPPIEELPHTAARLYPRSLQPLRKQSAVGRRRAALHDIAVREAGEILGNHHDTPRCGDLAIDRCRMRKPFRFEPAEAKLKRVADRLRMPEPLFEYAVLFGFERHAGVIYKHRFGDRRITGVARQLKGHRWSEPLFGLNLFDWVTRMNAFIMASKSMVPDRAAGRDRKLAGCVRNARAAAGHDVAKRYAIVERSHLKNETRVRLVVQKRELRRATMIRGDGMDAAGWIALVAIVPLD